MSNKFAVCVLSDDANSRASLKLVARSKSIPFLAFETTEKFYEGYTEKNVGCLILDLKQANLAHLEEMRSKNLLIPVIVLTGKADVQATVDAMKAGAVDVAEKPVNSEELLAKIQAAFAKADHFRKLASERNAVAPKIESLTPREIEVLDLMVSGRKNRKIAEELGISTKTLDIHRANIMRKMQTKTVADLVRWRLVNQADAGGVMPVIIRS